MPEIRRADRVARLLLAEISQLVRRDVRDPRVRDVTITRVDLTDDLRQATVWFTPLGGLGDEKRIAELQEGLDKAKLYVQGKVGRNLRLRVTDDLVRMHEVLGGLRSEGAMGEDAAPEAQSAEEGDDGSST